VRNRLSSSSTDRTPTLRRLSRKTLPKALTVGIPPLAVSRCATRATTADLWSAPVNLGPTVNSTAFDGAPALSFDGTTLYFFSDRPDGFGANDLYVTTRTRLKD
jgi:hypothetical protein